MESFNTNLLEQIISSGKTSKITHWEVEDFAQYPYARWDFDDDGVIVFKAKNSVGKSMGLKALQACLTTSWVGSGKIRRLIRHQCTSATVRVFFDDGVEIEYVMNLSSLAPKARFTNGYHLYYNQNGMRTEVYNTLQNNRYITVRETPLPIKRYLNLAEMSGKYLNIMRKSEGLMILDQTPKALMKSLSKVADLETAERAITQINKDNRETLDELRAGDTRVRLFENQIEERRCLTKEVMSLLFDMDGSLEDLEGVLGKLGVSVDLLADLKGLDLVPVVEKVNYEGLETAYNLSETLKSLEGIDLVPTIKGVSSQDLLNCYLVGQSLDDLSDIGFVDQQLPVISSNNLAKMWSISEKINGLDKDLTSLSPVVRNVGVKGLETASNVGDLISAYSAMHSKLGEGLAVLISTVKNSQQILENLKSQGYPVSKCGSCGDLTIMTELDLGDFTKHTHETEGI